MLFPTRNCLTLRLCRPQCKCETLSAQQPLLGMSSSVDDVADKKAQASLFSTYSGNSGEKGKCNQWLEKY
jgi:hypothetical protein